MGVAQLLASPFGATATPNYPVTATAHSLGATRSLHLPAACALLPLLLLASGLRPVTALPAVALAAIVAHNGLDLLADTLSDAWARDEPRVSEMRRGSPRPNPHCWVPGAPPPPPPQP